MVIFLFLFIAMALSLLRVVGAALGMLIGHACM